MGHSMNEGEDTTGYNRNGSKDIMGHSMNGGENKAWDIAGTRLRYHAYNNDNNKYVDS